MKLKITLFLLLYISINLYSEGDFSLGVAWQGKSPMALNVMNGMVEVLNNLAPELDIEVRKEIASREELRAVVNQFSTEKDAMVILRSNGAELLAEYPPSIPSFIGACNDPVRLGITTNMERPGGNITGVTYAIDMKIIFDFYKNILSNLDKILLLYEIGHPGSIIDRNKTQEICREIGIEYSDAGITDFPTAQQTIFQNMNEVDAVILGNQALLMANIEWFAAMSGSIPLLSYNSETVQSGVLASLSADDFKMGRILAGSVLKVLYDDIRIGDIPIETDRDPKIAINITTAEKLGLIIPMHILKVAEVHK